MYKSLIIAIDPGNTKSAYVFLECGKPIQSAKVENETMLRKICDEWHFTYRCVIEQVAGMGMPVGKEVFETCWWSGRFYEVVERRQNICFRIPRSEIKLHLCGSARAKDGNVICALVDRFDADRKFGKYGKGTKNNPGPLFGFAADEWAALACGVTFFDKNGGR